MNIRPPRATWLRIAAAIVVMAVVTAPTAVRAQSFTSGDMDYTNDGRSTLRQLSTRFSTLSTQHGWQAATVYRYPGESSELEIKAWYTPHRGEALWILAGIHGEEPAGPNAIARSLDHIVRLAQSGVPIVVIPLCNPRAYRHNWRYPNTAERDWRKGGYSVGDAEHVLPDIETGSRSRAATAPGPETRALTTFVLQLAQHYPPRLVLDLHEDELSTEGGYIYSQGSQALSSPVGAEVVRLLQANGIPIRQSGTTRFGEPIEAGVITRDDKGLPLRDGSIDELLGAAEVFVDGQKKQGPAASTVIVVETPAFAGSKLALRVAAHATVIEHVRELWSLASPRSPTDDANQAAPDRRPQP